MNYQKFCAGCHGANLEKFAAKAWMEEKGNASHSIASNQELKTLACLVSKNLHGF